MEIINTTVLIIACLSIITLNIATKAINTYIIEYETEFTIRVTALRSILISAIVGLICLVINLIICNLNKSPIDFIKCTATLSIVWLITTLAFYVFKRFRYIENKLISKI